MFQFMQLHLKKILLTITLPIILTFVVYFNVNMGSMSTESPVGELYGKPIEYDVFLNSYQAVAKEKELERMGVSIRSFPSMIPIEQEAFLRILMLKEADKDGLKIKDEEFQAWLAGLFSRPGQDGQIEFNWSDYQALITSELRLSVQEFETIARDSYIIHKLKARIESSNLPSEEDLKTYYSDTNTQVNFSYALLESKDFESKVSFTEEDLKTHFKEFSQDFRIPERIRLNYVFKGRSDFQVDSSQITDDELLGYYERNKSRFKIGNENEPDSEIFRPLEEVKDQLLTEISDSKTYTALQQFMDNVYKQMTEKSDFSGVASTHLLEIKTTDLFDRSNPPSEIGSTNSPQVQEPFLLPLNDFVGPYPFADGFLIVQVKEKLEARDPVDFNEVKDKVQSAYRQIHSVELAKKETEILREKVMAKSEILLPDKASSFGVSILYTGLINKKSYYIQNLGYEPALIPELFKLEEREVSSVMTIGNGDKYAFFQKFDEKTPDWEKFNSEKESIREKYLMTFQQKLFFDWLIKTQQEANLKITLPGRS